MQRLRRRNGVHGAPCRRGEDGDGTARRAIRERVRSKRAREGANLGSERARSRAARIPEGVREDPCEAIRRMRPRNHRICDLGRRACGDCDYRDHCFQAKAARALGCDIQWDKRLIADERGQSTVEYAIVFSALLCVLAGIGALMGVLDGGVFVHHAVTSASHCVQSSLTGLTDTLCF